VPTPAMDADQAEAADEFAFEPATSFDFGAKQVCCTTLCLPVSQRCCRRAPSSPPRVQPLPLPRHPRWAWRVPRHPDRALSLRLRTGRSDASKLV